MHEKICVSHPDTFLDLLKPHDAGSDTSDHRSCSRYISDNLEESHSSKWLLNTKVSRSKHASLAGGTVTLTSSQRALTF